jgi:F0F1-type ATP synthase assembly protein I
VDEQKKAEEKKAEQREREDQIRKIAVYTGIPGMMIGGPLAGWLLEILIHRFVPSFNKDILLAVCLMLGFFAGMYQVYELIKNFK